MSKLGIYPLKYCKGVVFMNAVGINISKGKSVIAILHPYGDVVSLTFEIHHISEEIRSLIEQIKSIEGETRIARNDGYQKWGDFATTYWHVDCVRKMSLSTFDDHYQKLCKRKQYYFNKSKAEKICGTAKELFPVLPKDNLTRLIIKQAVEQLNIAS